MKKKLFLLLYLTIPPVREQQTVRLQLKADGSVFDPAVQMVILEQIKQKLAEHKLQNIMVTWRKNPDGSVFRKKTSDDDNL